MGLVDDDGAPAPACPFCSASPRPWKAGAQAVLLPDPFGEHPPMCLACLGHRVNLELVRAFKESSALIVTLAHRDAKTPATPAPVRLNVVNETDLAVKVDRLVAPGSIVIRVCYPPDELVPA